MEDRAGPSNGLICKVCDNVRTDSEMSGNTCLACHTWFNLNIDFYKTMDEPSCVAKKNGNYCQDFACLTCKIERYLSHNTFKNTMGRCVICRSLTYVCEKNPVCSNCGMLWQERHSYTKSKKCSCSTEESKVCQVCCLKKLVRHKSGKYLPSAYDGDGNTESKQIFINTAPGYFYSEEFNVNCNISSIHSHLQERTRHQLSSKRCLVVLKKIPLRPKQTHQETKNVNDGIFSDTSSSLDVCISSRRKRIFNLFGDTSDEENDLKPAKMFKPSLERNNTYNVVSVKETCLRLQGNQSPADFEASNPDVVDWSDTASSDVSLSQSTNESSFPYSDSSVKSHRNAATSKLPINFKTSSVISEIEESPTSPIIASKKRSQQVQLEPATRAINGNTQVRRDSSATKDQSVQTEGFFEDVLPKITELHILMLYMKNEISKQRPSPNQSFAMLQKALDTVIEFCEPISLRDRISAQPSPFNLNLNLSNRGINCLAGPSQNGPPKSSHSKEPVIRENKAKRSKKFRKDIIAEVNKKAVKVVLKRLSIDELRRHGIDPNSLNLPAAKGSHEKRPRKISVNSESSTMGSISENTSTANNKLRIKAPTPVNCDLDALDFEPDSLNSSPDLIKASCFSKQTNDRGSSSLRRETGNKPKSTKSCKEKHQSKTAESKALGKKPEREKKTSESEGNRKAHKAPKSVDAKESKNFEKPPKTRIPKIKSSASTRPVPPAATASLSAGLPPLLQDNLNQLQNGKRTPSPSVDGARLKAPQTSTETQAAEKSFAKVESKTIEKPTTYRDVDMFSEEYPPGPASTKKKSILNICPPKKDDSNKAKVTVNPNPYVRCISPIRNSSEMLHIQPRSQQPFQEPVATLPQQYVASVLDELDYVPESSPRPMVQGIRPFHPPKVRIEKQNAPVPARVTQRNDVSSETRAAAPVLSRSKFKRNRKSLFSSSSSDSASISSESCDSDSDSETTSIISEQAASTAAATTRIIQNNQASDTGKIELSECTSSSSTDGAHSPSSETSDELAGVASFIAREIEAKPAPLSTSEAKQEYNSFEAVCSPKCTTIFSPRRGSVPAVLVSPYRDEPDESSAIQHDTPPPYDEEENQTSENEAEEQSQGNGDTEKEETGQEEMEPDDGDCLFIGLAEDERFAEEYVEENETKQNQSRGPKDQQDREAKPSPVDVALEQRGLSSSAWSDPVPPQIPLANRTSDPRNTVAARRFPTSGAIPTARVMPQFEAVDRRHHPQRVAPIPPRPDIEAIISKGMCLNFVKTGECPPKPHEICVYCHDADPEIVYVVIRSYCENTAKLLNVKRLIQAMMNQQSPFQKYLHTNFGRTIVSTAIEALLKDNREDLKHFAICKLNESCIPPLPELIEMAISHAPDLPRTAPELKKLCEKYTRASVTISKLGWQKVIHVVRHRPWQDLLDTISMALQHQRFYCPSEEFIASLFRQALEKNLPRRVEVTCEILQGIGSQAFQSLSIELKSEVLKTLQSKNSPLLTTYMRLFEYKPIHPQQMPLFPNPPAPMHSMQQCPTLHIPPVRANGPFQHNPSVPVNPSQQLLSQHNAPRLMNRPPVAVAQPPVQWPSTNEVSSILRSDALLPPVNTAHGLVGPRMHFENAHEARSLAGSNLPKNVANSTPDVRASVMARLGPQMVNGTERILPIHQPKPFNYQSFTPSVGLAVAHPQGLNTPSSVSVTEVHPQISNDPPPQRKQEFVPTLVVPKPSQALDQNLFHSDGGSVKECAEDPNAVLKKESVPPAAPTDPYILELDNLFAHQNFDDEKFEKVVELLFKSLAEDVSDQLMAHLIKLITTKPLYNAEGGEEPLSLSSITARILYNAMKEGDATTLPSKQRDLLLNLVGSVVFFFYSKYQTAASEDDKDFYLKESEIFIKASTPFELNLEKCTKNPNVLIFIAECYVNKWEDSSPPLEEEDIEDLVDSLVRALYVLTEFHRLVANFNVEKAIALRENRVCNIIFNAVQWIIASDGIPPEVPCVMSDRAAVEGALEDYNMEAMKNASRFGVILEGGFE